MEQNWFEDEVVEAVELTQFEKMCQEAYAQKEIVDDLSAREKIENEKLTKMKYKLLAYMEKFGKQKYPVSGYGTISIAEKFTAKMPKDLDKKKEFFAFLRDKNLFESMITVHANTLNSFVETEVEEAKKVGNADFKIPGIDEFGFYKTLSLRSK